MTASKGNKYTRRLVQCVAMPLAKAATSKSKRVTATTSGGVYAIYYKGDVPLYQAAGNHGGFGGVGHPVYVGKSLRALDQRLRTHLSSLKSAKNLSYRDFSVRFIELPEGEIETAENALCTFFQPLWNFGIRGFGNKVPGRGRSRQARSAWDTVHPGRGYGGRKRTDEDPSVLLEQLLATHSARLATRYPAVV